MVMPAPDVLAALAALLDYPGTDLAARAAACADRLAAVHADAARRVAEFAAAVAKTAPGRLEELYTAAIDLDAQCSPHLGHRLLGDDPRRGVLMSRLAARYRARGFAAGRELPDHLAVVLRFLAHAPDEPDADELVRDGLVPALGSLARELARRAHPWAPVAEAARLVLAAAVSGS